MRRVSELYQLKWMASLKMDNHHQDNQWKKSWWLTEKRNKHKISLEIWTWSALHYFYQELTDCQQYIGGKILENGKWSTFPLVKGNFILCINNLWYNMTILKYSQKYSCGVMICYFWFCLVYFVSVLDCRKTQGLSDFHTKNTRPYEWEMFELWAITKNLKWVCFMYLHFTW